MTKGVFTVPRARYFATFSLVLSSLICVAQNAEQHSYSQEIVRAKLAGNQAHVSASFVDKNIPKLGDQAAIAIIKMFPAADLHSPPAIREILPILRDAFSIPAAIKNPDDRHPQITFLLLDEFDRGNSDTGLHEQIRELRQYVQGQVATIEAPASKLAKDGPSKR